MPPFDELECPICGQNLHNHTGIQATICISLMRSRQWWDAFRDSILFASEVRQDIDAL